MTGIEFDKYTQLHLWCLLTNDLVFPRISAPLTMTFQFMSTSRLLDNAVAAIRVGIEDFSDGSEGRLLSSVRNVTSGLLLLYKEVLRRMSPENDPELLIKQNLRPVIDDGELILRATGKKTINVETIISRLKDCGVGLDDEKKKLLKTVISTRNEVEHYYVEFTSVKIEQLLGKEFLLVYDVVCRLLKENPMGLFGEECWESLLGIKDVYCEQKKFCTESYELVNWKFDVVKDSLCELTCPECGSDLVKAVSNGSVFPSINMRCTLCSHEFCFSSVLAKCFSEHMEQICYSGFHGLWWNPQ